MQARLAISLTVLVCAVGLPASGRAAEKPPVFEKDIRPILAKKCGKCHSDKVRKGGLDLSNFGGLLRGGESGEAAVGETLDESLLWTMIDDGGMPPEDSPQLSKNELALIRRWITSGAKAEKPVAPSEKQITQHDVLPIVLLRCTTCHGPRRKDGGLDLRTPAAMLKGGDSGPALVKGKPEMSLMIQRIESQACPPRALLLKFFVRRPSTGETDILRQWIAAGAPEVDVKPDVATTEPDLLVTDADRKHWAFQPPKVTGEGKSIDEFIIKKLKANDLTFSPQADRDTLIRRAYLDLIGMPPSVDQWKRWRGDSDPNWYAKMIDHLLASPRYGERWGRYWLDLAGYADSEGGTSADPLRQVSWKYRDYVIAAFNADKPYDQFLLEQIAGDELVDYQNAKVVTDKMVENLIATGFLRQGIDETGSRTMNFVPERLGVISDAIKVVGSGVMGLTLECSRCHSHKYDPIPQRDYYRLKAIFQGALDEHDWMSFKTRRISIATPEHRRKVAKVNPRLEKQVKSLLSRVKKTTTELHLLLLRSHYPDQTEADRKATLVALRIADNNRTLTQRILVEKLQTAEVLPDAQQPESVLKPRRDIKAMEDEIGRLQRRMAPTLAIRALWDRGEPSPTYLLRRGEHDKPGQLVGPGVPSALTDGRTPFTYESPFPGKSGRRLAFARWLTRPDNPLTARVMVNRIWHHHFGVGLVKSLENFGTKGAAPTHPQLLDLLAVRFVEHRWSIKQMHRLIMNSQTYKQSSRITPERFQLDPQNRLLSRMPLKRMNAEALRDSLLFVSGKLDETPGGLPDPVSVDRDGLVAAKPTADGRWRRSVYLQYRRTEIPTMMNTFDYPVMGPNCIERSVSTVSPQSLMLMNNKRIRVLAAALASRVRDSLTEPQKNDRNAQIDLVYQIALTRLPSQQEKQIGVEALQKLESTWQGDKQAALETYCHTILNSGAFIYID